MPFSCSRTPPGPHIIPFFFLMSWGPHRRPGEPLGLADAPIKLRALLCHVAQPDAAGVFGSFLTRGPGISQVVSWSLNHLVPGKAGDDTHRPFYLSGVRATLALSRPGKSCSAFWDPEVPSHTPCSRAPRMSADTRCRVTPLTFCLRADTGRSQRNTHHLRHRGPQRAQQPGSAAFSQVPIAPLLCPCLSVPAVWPR